MAVLLLALGFGPAGWWLRDFGWTVPTLIDVDGTVVGSSGPLTAPDMAEIAESLAAG